MREAARLQWLPDSFVFRGSETDRYKQVGDAVPPLLGYHVAKALLMAMAAPEADYPIDDAIAGELFDFAAAV